MFQMDSKSATGRHTIHLLLPIEVKTNKRGFLLFANKIVKFSVINNILTNFIR